ncbi:MAG: hypothetical protein PVH67_11640, partial [Desulfobacterales bacterium]
METIFFFNRSIAAGCVLAVLFLWCWSHLSLSKKTNTKLWNALIMSVVTLPLLGKLREICSNRKIWNWKSFCITLRTRSANLGIPLLILLILLLGSAYSARAATRVMCSDFGGVVDGSKPSDYNRVRSASTFGIDMNCTIKNFPESIGGFPITNINFYFPDNQDYLIIFDNVYYDGNMSCNDPTQAEFTFWLTNDSFTDISSSCQQFIIPVDGIHKNNPAGQTTATIGEPFTYTLTFPDMAMLTESGYVYSGNPDTQDIYHIQITDDLTATGVDGNNPADLTYVNNTAVLKDINGSIITQLTNSGDNKHLSFSYLDNPALSLIPAGTQLVLEFTVVLDDTSANYAGKQFINTAHWELGRMINGTNFEPLPGQDGITPPMTIVGPDLVVTKSTTATALNIGDTATFTIDVQNNGSGDAWNTTILDNIAVGMCTYDPTSGIGVSAQIFEADGVTEVYTLDQAANDYSVTYSSATCQLSLTMESANAVIGPSQHLIITYQSQLDPGFSNSGATLTNVAGATQWFSAESGYSDRRQYGPFTLTNGTPTILDFQDNESVTAALNGYYFEKTVEDLNTGMYPATTAAPGDTLHYHVRLFNLTEDIDGITLRDELDVVNTFTGPPTNVTVSAGSFSFNQTGGTSGTGQLEVTGVDVAQGDELVIDFDITLRSTLTNGTVVSNQASLNADQGTPSDPTDDFFATSDDPYTNGVSSPDDPDDQDPTDVEIQTPGPLSKANTQGNATIGEQ